MRFDDEDFYVDLVFYNYLLRCFVLIDLKVGKLTHQDIGQLESYVRMFDAHARPEGDNPTIDEGNPPFVSRSRDERPPRHSS